MSQPTDGETPESRRGFRFGIRGLLVALLVTAAVLAAVRPFVREPLQGLERYVKVRLNERDLYHHVDDARGVAEKFVKAIRSGRIEDARGLTTVGYRRRMGAGEFGTLPSQTLRVAQSCELVEGTLHFSDARGRFVSEWIFRCDPKGQRAALTIITEAGELKVDGIEPKDPEGP